MCTEEQRQWGQCDMAMSFLCITDSCDADRGDDSTADQISFGGKTHLCVPYGK
jgi:hypothetical protein